MFCGEVELKFFFVLFKSTVLQTEKALLTDQSHILRVSRKFCILSYL